MKTLLNKLKKENLEKIESNMLKYEYSAKNCLSVLKRKHFWIELQMDEALLLLSMTTDKIFDVNNLVELFENN
jgi:hypothetical protein